MSDTDSGIEPSVVATIDHYLQRAGNQSPSAQARMILPRAALSAESGEPGATTRLLQELQSLQPQNPYPSWQLVPTYDVTQQWDEALRWYLWLLSHAGSDAQGRSLLSWTYPPRHWRSIQSVLNDLADDDMAAAQGQLDQIDPLSMESFVAAYFIVQHTAEGATKCAMLDDALQRLRHFHLGDNRFQNRWVFGLLPEALKWLRVCEGITRQQLAATIDWLRWRGEDVAAERVCAGNADKELEPCEAGRASLAAPAFNEMPSTNLIVNGAFAGRPGEVPRGWHWSSAANRAPYASALFDGGVKSAEGCDPSGTVASIYGIWASPNRDDEEAARAGFWIPLDLEPHRRYLLSFCYRSAWTERAIAEVWIGGPGGTLLSYRPDPTDGQWQRKTLVVGPFDDALPDTLALRSWGEGVAEFDDVGLFVLPQTSQDLRSGLWG